MILRSIELCFVTFSLNLSSVVLSCLRFVAVASVLDCCCLHHGALQEEMLLFDGLVDNF